MAKATKKIDDEVAHSAVADGIVREFLGALHAEEGMQHVVDRLRKTLLTDHSYSDASLQKALFDEEAL